MSFLASPDLLVRLVTARTTTQVDSILGALPIVNPDEYQWDYANKRIGNWRPGHLHWLPVGLRRGNGGQIRLAGEPVNPIAERLVNGMESIIELARIRGLRENSAAPEPTSPRDAVMQYFGLPRLDVVERMEDMERKAIHDKIDELRRMLAVHLDYDKRSSQFAITVRDRGMGQSPGRIHESLLSLGESDKPEKPYLIGLFGQGGSSAFMACHYSVVLSRRAPDILIKSENAGVGWSIVRQIFLKGRRDPYFAYLAASETGTVPRFELSVAEQVGFEYGAHFSHIKYDFGGTASAVTRMLYQALKRFEFEVAATGPKGRALYARFLGEVVDPTTTEKPGPRMVDSEFPSGASRRPPYELNRMNWRWLTPGFCSRFLAFILDAVDALGCRPTTRKLLPRPTRKRRDLHPRP
jgi:hypothetical protein